MRIIKLFTFGVLLLLTHEVFAKTLTIGLLSASREQRKAYERIGVQFKIENRGTDVEWIVKNDARYKKKLDSWLRKAGPDVLYWQAGKRLKALVDRELIEPIDDIWNENKLDQDYSQGIKNTVTFKGKIYGIPYSFYQWGFYYKKSTFANYNLEPPETWDEFIGMCKILRENGVVPIVIGTKNFWTTAAWFDYLNLRINGLAFHQKVTEGQVSYLDPGIQSVFEYWKGLIDGSCFVTPSKQRSWDWAQTLPDLFQGEAGVGLYGNFVAPKLQSSKFSGFRYFPFPKIADVPRAEEAPTEVFMIPRNSRNKELAKKFLAFIARADIQQQLNNSSGNVSTNLKAKVAHDYFIQEGKKVLHSAAGFSQFFDRDVPKEMADKAVRIFTQFMVDGNIHNALQDLESARLASY